MKLTELIVYSPSNSMLGYLPNYVDTAANSEYNEYGSGSVDYPVLGKNYTLLQRLNEVAFVVDRQEVFRWVLEDWDGTKFSDAKLGAIYKFTGRGTLSILERGIVLPPNWPSVGETTVNWKFNSVTAGKLIRDLILACQARGTLTEITISSFTNTTTSSGVAWGQNVTLEIEPQRTIASVVAQLVEMGVINVRMVGHDLRVYNVDQLGVDKTTGANPVILYAGRDFKEAPFKGSIRETVNRSLIRGDQWAFNLTDDLTSQTALGVVIEGGITIQGTQDAALLSYANQTFLTASSLPKEERSIDLVLPAPKWKPHTDYGSGDWVYIDSSGTKERLRIIQVNLGADKNRELKGGLTLNTKFVDADIRLKKQLDKLLNGSEAYAGSPSETPTSADSLAPGQVTGLVLSTSTYFDAAGRLYALLTAGWAALTANSDGSAMNDLAGYDVQIKRTADTNWGSNFVRNQSSDTNATFTQLLPNVQYQARVRAFDRAGNYGAFSSTVALTSGTDTTAPNAPSTPVATEHLSTARVLWDGKDSSNAAMPLDFLRVLVHRGTTVGFVTSSATQVGSLDGPGAYIDSDLAYGTTYYYKFVAYDTSGNASAASAASNAVVANKVTGIDIASGTIGYDAIGFKDFDNLVPDGSFENPAIDTQRTYDAGWSYVTDAANAFHRDRFVRGNGATSPGTYRVFYLTGHIDVRSGDQFFVRCAYRRSVGANGTLKITAEAYNNAGVAQYLQVFLLGNITGNWVEVSTVYTPAADIERVRFYAEMVNDVTTGLNDLDAVEIRHVVGTALIQDAAISRAKIQDLAVDNAKIADLDGGKITAQSITSEEIKVGVLGKNLVPNSSFEDDYGWTLIPYANQGVGYYDGQAGVAYSGSRAMVSGATAVVGGENHGMTFRSDWFSVKPGASYRQQVFARASVAMGNGLYMRLEWADDLTGAGATGAVINEMEAKGCGTVYEEFSQEYTAPAGKNAARMYLHHYNPNVTCNLWFDDAAVIEIGVGASQLTPAGLKVWDITGDLVIDMTYKPLGFGNTFAIMKNGSAVASIDSDGRVNASEIFTDKITLGGADLDGTLDTKAGGVVTSSFTWPLTGTATARKGLGELSFMHKPDRNYRVIFNGIQVQSSIAGDRALVSMRYTIDGSTPTVSNGIIADGVLQLCQVAGNGYSVAPMIIMGNFVPGVVTDTLVRLLITIERFSGSGTLTYNTYTSTDVHRKPFRLFVEDIGFDVPDTFLANDGSASAPAGSKTRYTKTYNASWSQTYRSDNNKNTVSGNDAYQGYYSGTNGNQKALIGFPAQVQTDLGAGTVEKCEVYLYFYHWYNNSGGTAIIGTHGNTSEPATAPAAGFNRVQSPSWPKPGGRWVNLGTGIGSEFKSSGSTRGITLGPGPSSGSLYYGKAYGATGAYPAKLRITYVK